MMRLLVEDEDGVLVRELVVDDGEGRELVLDVVALLVLRVEGHLEELRAVDAAARALGHNLRRAADVVEDRLLDARERAVPRAQRVALAAEVRAEDRAVGREDDVALRELLLELADEAALDLLDALPGAVRHEDDGDLAAGLDLRRVRDLEVEERLGDLELELVRRRALLLDNL